MRVGVERGQGSVRVGAVGVVVVDLERLEVVVEELVRVVVVVAVVVVEVVVVGVVVRRIRIGDVEWSKCGSCGRSRHLENVPRIFFIRQRFASAHDSARRLAEDYRQTVIFFFLFLFLPLALVSAARKTEGGGMVWCVWCAWCCVVVGGILF